MDWMIMPLKRYADFNGRSRRKEYWMFTLGLILLLIVLVIIPALIGVGSQNGGAGGGIVALLLPLVFLGLIVPSLAVQVRRFHDQDKSGWFVLLGLIPIVGGIITLVFMCTEGTRGPNRFGADPKNSTDHLDTVFR